MSDVAEGQNVEKVPSALAVPLAGGTIGTKEQLDAVLDDTTGRATGALDNLTVYRQGKENYFKVGERKVESLLGIFMLSRRPTRAYWPKDEMSNTPPECYSFDGIVPHETASKPQAEKCADCPWDKMGSGKGKSRKCKQKASDFVLVVPDDYERDHANNLAWPDPKRVIPAVLMYSISNRGSARSYQDWLRSLKEHNHRPQGVLTRWSFGEDESKSGVDYSFVRMETVLPLPGPENDDKLWDLIVKTVVDLKGGRADAILTALSGTMGDESNKD